MPIIRSIIPRIDRSTAPVDLMKNMEFLYYPQAGIVFDLAKNRNSDQAANLASLVFSRNQFGTPTVNGTDQMIWSNGITKDIEMKTSGVGVSLGYSFWLWLYVGAVSNGTTDYCEILSRAEYTDETNNKGWSWIKTPTTHGSDGTPRLSLRFYNNNGSANYEMKDTTVALSAGQLANYVGLIGFDSGGGGGTKQLYRDGVSRVTPSGHGYVIPSSGVGLNIGGIAGSNNLFVMACGVWSRTLTIAEISALYALPEQLVQIPLRNEIQVWPGSATPPTIFRPSPIECMTFGGLIR